MGEDGNRKTEASAPVFALRLAILLNARRSARSRLFRQTV
jgi:hypothetical protein